MVDVEVLSWHFVYRVWENMRKMPYADRGFEESFRHHLSQRMALDCISSARDTGLGLSYTTLSDTPHELDIIFRKESNLFVFELKHYNVSRITKEIVFTFLGKVFDFYLKNLEVLRSQKITMYLVTVNRALDDSIWKLCLTYGIKLITPSLMTMGTLDHYARDLYNKIPDSDSSFKTEVEKLIEDIATLREDYDFVFSDIFRYSDGKAAIELPFPEISPTYALERLKELNAAFTAFKEKFKRWRSEKS
ncbi:MAG: hypothetical protein QXH32_06970 [Candidatus Caldarchaeum sp.]